MPNHRLFLSVSSDWSPEVRQMRLTPANPYVTYQRKLLPLWVFRTATYVGYALVFLCFPLAVTYVVNVMALDHYLGYIEECVSIYSRISDWDYCEWVPAPGFPSWVFRHLYLAYVVLLITGAGIYWGFRYWYRQCYVVVYQGRVLAKRSLAVPFGHRLQVLVEGNTQANRLTTHWRTIDDPREWDAMRVGQLVST